MAEVERTGVDGAWIVQLTVREFRDDQPYATPTWTLYVGHNDQGHPVYACLVRGPVEISHEGRSRVCPSCRDGRPTIDIESGRGHYYLQPAGDESASLDPEELVRALARSRNKALLSDGYHNPDLAVDDWRDKVAWLIAKRQLVPPPDLLPLLANGTIAVPWRAEWLRQPEVLVPGNVSITCTGERGRYEVKVVIHSRLAEDDGEGSIIAADLAYGLDFHYRRRFTVTVDYDQTGPGEASGVRP